MSRTDWFAWLRADPQCEPFLSIAAAWEADKARLAEAEGRIRNALDALSDGDDAGAHLILYAYPSSKEPK